MTTTQAKNYFECLYESDDEEEPVSERLPILPDEIVNMIISYNLKPTPIALLIEYRFSYNYNGIRTIYEINALKEVMDKANKKYADASSKYSEYRSKCYSKISEQRKMCGEDCMRILQEHLNICTATPCKCNSRSVAYDCEFKDNGRCSHYYIIQNEKEDIDEYDCYEHEYSSKYETAKYEYTIELAKKEGWIEEYEQQIEDQYESAYMDSLRYF